ncbi:MAG TPA: gamma-aminobutyraldehyde dehydrogenase [Thermoleophilaceae bacterium]|jgi:betaine-aldehyde dehydrogenase/aminobutyraldehyde dehydrogenase
MAVIEKSYEMFIGGRQVPAAEGETEPVINPATGEQIAEVAKGSSRDVDEAVKVAEKAFDAWAATPPNERALALLKLADRLEEHAEEFAQLESLNVGKPISAAREEIPFAADHLRFFAGAARTLEGRAAGEYASGYTSIIRRDPLGVVGSVAPWNFPLLMGVWKIGPALMTGNTLVLKPSEHTPLTTLRLAELAADLFPEGVLNIVTGHGDPVGVALVSHPRVRMSSLTGDVSTGKAVMQAASGNLKKLHLELGGKAPVIIFDDADLDLAVERIREGGYSNSGQDCMASSRIYASEGVHDDFLSVLKPAVESISMGDPTDESTEMGPVITERQQQRVKGFVDRALETGHAELVTGGDADGPGFFYKPSIVIGAQQGDEIVQNEVFGPVVSVTRFDNDEEVLRWANDVEYGLAASVFTNNVGRALNAARVLQFGTVWINDHMPIVAEMPHGGFKQSGNGNDMSVYSLEEYTEIKHVMVRLSDG